MNNIRVRFPPSPTGFCHVGTARMAIVNYLFARKAGGSIVFRSEDTDRERSKKEYEDDILEQLTWLGLSWDEFVRQSERLEWHRASLQKLLDEDKAYLSEEESKREPGTRVMIVRLRNAGRRITFNDVIRGDITFDTTELGDFAIARAVDDPLYHFAVVVDDVEMGITHVIRGEEHISNTPRQILIQEALGYTRPVYAHYPLLLGTDRAKLSKRKGDVAVRDYRAEGFLAPALANFIGTLGWTPPSGREVLSLDEMVAEFELADLHKSGAVFNLEKLRWFNRQYLECMPDGDFARYVLPSLRDTLAGRDLRVSDDSLLNMLPILRERTSVATDISEMGRAGEFDFFFAQPTMNPSFIPEKKSSAADASKHLAWLESTLQGIPEGEWRQDRIKDAVWDYATKEGRGAVLWPLRFALSGREKSPDPFTIAALIGKHETSSRIAAAREMLQI